MIQWICWGLILGGWMGGFGVVIVMAQPEAPCVTSPENVTVVLPADLQSALGSAGERLAPGDVIMFVVADGTCVGRDTWKDDGIHVSVAGAIRPEDTGYTPGDSLRMRIRDVSAQITSAVDAIQYQACPPGLLCSSEGQYVTDGLLIVSAVEARTEQLSADHPLVVTAPHPNPSGRCGQFAVGVAEEQEVRVALYNALGQRVRVLHRGPLPAGRMRSFRVCKRHLASGAYFIHVTSNASKATRRITFIQ